MLGMRPGSHAAWSPCSMDPVAARQGDEASPAAPRDLPKGPLKGASEPCHRASPLRAQGRNLARPNMDPHVSRPTGSPGLEADLAIAAKGLIAPVRAAREECERLRRMPVAVVEALAAAGLLQMYLPRAMGGPEVAPLVAFRAIEAISSASGSIGWCTMIATAVS